MIRFAFVAVLLLLAGPASAAALPQSAALSLSWGEAGNRILAGVQERPILVVNAAGGTVTNVTLVVEAPRQPIDAAIAAAPAEGRRSYAVWSSIPASGTSAVLGFKHSDDFSGAFEIVGHWFFDLANGTRVYARSELVGTVAGGLLEYQPWQVYIGAVVVLVLIAAAVFRSRKK